jgi:hypothetical protein
VRVVVRIAVGVSFGVLSKVACGGRVGCRALNWLFLLPLLLGHSPAVAGVVGLLFLSEDVAMTAICGRSASLG